MGRTKSHSSRRHEGHRDASIPRRNTPLDSDTDMFGSPEIWCKKKTNVHRNDTKGHRSRKDVGAGEEPRKKKDKHRKFYSHLNRLIEMASKHRYRDITTPARELRANSGHHGYGRGCSTPPPPPPLAPFQKSSPYTPKRYLLNNESGMGITPPPSYRSRREHHHGMPASSPTPMEIKIRCCAPMGGASPDFSPPNTSSTSSSSSPLSNLLNPTCESCVKTHQFNSTFRQSLLAHTREMYSLLQSWSDEGSRSSVEQMEWQPESTAVVIEKERRPSEMCKVLMSMGSVEDWVGVMRGLEEKEGGTVGAETMEVERTGKRIREDINDGEEAGDSGGLGAGGEYCLPLRQRRMAVDEGGGQG
ncbi:hypothetical protein B0T20DRAFT_7423 [Sordaria brevicollis]|uniref:Uncharacterized protein n=1 Tax=Sordaria brevicollis TaxID=83679 RepID=A0AAE0UGC0_SORBR|nr:hypothetical protein B0T20DRAFT_7423 [Sordaria brevicollis]